MDWKLFYPTDPAVVPQASRLIDTRLAPSLSTLPPIVVTDNGPVTLTVRNLMRRVALGLPSGHAVAEHLGVTPYSGNLVDPGGGALTIPDQAAARGILRAVGMRDEDFAKPQIGVASTWNLFGSIHSDGVVRGSLAYETDLTADWSELR